MKRTGYYALATVLVLMLAAVTASAQVGFSLGFGGRSGAGVITFGSPYPYYYPYGGYSYYPYSYYPYAYTAPYPYYQRYYRGYGYDRYYDRDRGRRDYYRYRR